MCTVDGPTRSKLSPSLAMQILPEKCARAFLSRPNFSHDRGSGELLPTSERADRGPLFPATEGRRSNSAGFLALQNSSALA
jgi:transposase InsO family protein